MWTHCRAVSMLFAIALCTSSCLPPGQRLLNITIERDGLVTFKGFRGVPDTMPVDQMWGVLEDVRFDLVNNSVKLSNNDQGKSCSLSGKVIVRFYHVDENLLRADLNSMSLQKAKDDNYWYLDKRQARRVEKAGKR